MLTTRKMYGDTTTREHAQALADEKQRPVAVYSYGTTTVRGGKLRMRVRPTYRTIEDVKKRNAATGDHWFSPGNMRFFSSRVQDRIYVAKDGRAFFVSSERNTFANPSRRMYSVRVAELDGSINTVGDFQAYTTGSAAHAAARKAAQS